MPVRLLTARILLAIVVGVALSVATGTPDVHVIQFLVVSAHAQSNQQNPIEKARTAVETLINRLRGRDMPEGIVKTNGRLEATEVDVAAKYPDRLATLTVDEGDEVTAGQVVATISSPETEAQLRGAQAQVLKAKKALAEAVALIAQRKSDLDFTRTDYERGKMLVEHENIPVQVVDQRRNKFEAAEAGYVAANAQRDQAEAAIKAAEADVERLQSILVGGRVQYRLARAGRSSRQASAF
jgi:HlyD family secretion protein